MAWTVATAITPSSHSSARLPAASRVTRQVTVVRSSSRWQCRGSSPGCGPTRECISRLLGNNGVARPRVACPHKRQNEASVRRLGPWITRRGGDRSRGNMRPDDRKTLQVCVVVPAEALDLPAGVAKESAASRSETPSGMWANLASRSGRSSMAWAAWLIGPAMRSPAANCSTSSPTASTLPANE